MPGWLPPGFVFSRWSVLSHNVLCDQGPVVRFVRGSAHVTWRGKRWQLPCRNQQFAASVAGNRTTFFRRDHGTDTAWACVNVGFPLTFSVSQRSGSNGASAADLERMVASARPLHPGRARDTRSEPLPPAYAHNAAAAFGSPLFLPQALPAGFIFSRWHIVRSDPNVDGRRALYVTYGRDGPVLEWSVLAGTDTFGLDCPEKPSSLAPEHPVLINGRRVFSNVGIHGGSAWTCIPRNAVHNLKPLEIKLWYDIRLDGAAMRRMVSRMVATAKPVSGG